MKYYAIALLAIIAACGTTKSTLCGDDGECNDPEITDIDEGGIVGTNDGSGVFSAEIGPASGTPSDGNLIEGPSDGGPVCNPLVRDCSTDIAK